MNIIHNIIATNNKVGSTACLLSIDIIYPLLFRKVLLNVEWIVVEYSPNVFKRRGFAKQHILADLYTGFLQHLETAARHWTTLVQIQYQVVPFITTYILLKTLKQTLYLFSIHFKLYLNACFIWIHQFKVIYTENILFFHFILFYYCI